MLDESAIGAPGNSFPVRTTLNKSIFVQSKNLGLRIPKFEVLHFERRGFRVHKFGFGGSKHVGF